jgi:hypothetical protein
VKITKISLKYGTYLAAIVGERVFDTLPCPGYNRINERQTYTDSVKTTAYFSTDLIKMEGTR